MVRAPMVGSVAHDEIWSQRIRKAVSRRIAGTCCVWARLAVVVGMSSVVYIKAVTFLIPQRKARSVLLTEEGAKWL